jgi:hypothetical protein
MRLALAQAKLSRWWLPEPAKPMQPGPEPGLLAWQQARQSASQRRLAFSRPVWLLAWRQVLQPVWQRQVWLLVSLQLVWRQWLAWQRRQVSQQQFWQPV